MASSQLPVLEELVNLINTTCNTSFTTTDLNLELADGLPGKMATLNITPKVLYEPYWGEKALQYARLDIAAYLSKYNPTVTVGSSASVGDVIQALVTAYGTDISNSDVAHPGEIIVFDGNGNANVTLEILGSSMRWYGTGVIKAKRRSA